MAVKWLVDLNWEGRLIGGGGGGGGVKEKRGAQGQALLTGNNFQWPFYPQHHLFPLTLPAVPIHYTLAVKSLFGCGS